MLKTTKPPDHALQLNDACSMIARWKLNRAVERAHYTAFSTTLITPFTS
jgi:hypothetical protein